MIQRHQRDRDEHSKRTFTAEERNVLSNGSARFTYVEETGIKSVSCKANREGASGRTRWDGQRINKLGAGPAVGTGPGPVHTGRKDARKEATRRRLKKRVYCCRGSFLPPSGIVSTGCAFESVPVCMCVRVCAGVCECVYDGPLVIYGMFR